MDEPAAALIVFEEALTLTTQIDDLKGRIEALDGIGTAYRLQQQYEDAIEPLETMAQLAQSLDDPALEHNALINLAQLYRDKGDSAIALEYYQQGLEFARAHDDQEREIQFLDNIARLQSDEGDNEAAVSTYQEVLALAQASGRPELEQEALEKIGQFYRDSGQTEDALTIYAQLLARATDADDSAGEFSALDNMARIQRDGGNLSETRTIYQTILARAEANNDDQLIYETRVDLAKTEKRLGNYSEATALYETLLEEARETGDLMQEANFMIEMGEIGKISGNYADVLAQYGQALAILEEGQDVEAAVMVQLAIGDTYRELGQFDQALPYYQKALVYYQNNNGSEPLVLTLNDIGTTYRTMGDYNRALASYEEAAALLDDINDPDLTIDTLTNIGKVHRALRNRDQALTTYQEALAVAKTINDPLEVAQQLLNIGNAYAELGELEEAIANFNEARAIAEAEESLTTVAKALGDLGKMYRRSSQYELALEILQEALVLHQELGDHAAEAETLNDLGSIYLNIFQPERAIAPYERGLAVAQATHNIPLATEILTGLGQAYENQGNLEQAITTYQAAIALGIGYPIELETYQRLLSLLWDSGDLGDVFMHMEQALASSFLDEDGNPWLDIRSKAAPELAEREQVLRLEMIGLQRAIENENKKPLAQRQEALLQELASQYEERAANYQDVLRRLREQDPEYSSFLGMNVLTLDELRNDVLDENTTLIQYFILRKQAVAWVVDKERAVLVPLDITYNELVNQIGDFYDKIAAQEDSSQEVSSLYARLFTPLHSFVRNSNLVIVPHSVLHYAPFSAFYNAQSEQYLAESYAVTYAPSATLYQQLLKKRNPNGGRVLVMGNDVMGNDGEPLPFARQEARVVGESFGAVPRIGTEATESDLYTQASELDILHLAVAGLYEPREPLFSKLALTADEENDGLLEAYEIFSKLDLSDANLVVLAGNSHPSDEPLVDGTAIQALTWAFQYAGSPAVLTSNWQVDDASVATFFESFYRHLLENRTTAEALRLAQLEILANPATASPYYWAAFHLIGDYQGDGTIESAIDAETDAATTDTQTAAGLEVDASDEATGTTVVTSGLGGITQPTELANVFVVTEGAEIAGLPATDAAENAADNREAAGDAGSGDAVTMPLGELTNGACNNITLPLGLVLVADFFRRNLFRKRKEEEDAE